MTLPTRWPDPRGPARSARALPILAVLLLGFTPATAQRPDFLFGRPHATLAFMGGWAMPGEGSDMFSESRRWLTVSRGDFASPVFMVEAAVRVTDRIDVTVGVDAASSTVVSEDREYVTQDDRPIYQTTEFDRRRLTGGLKAYLLPRGRSISEYAWVPGAWSPYVGGGVGVSWYEFVQYGDFVDYLTLEIFEHRFPSRGHGFTTYAAGGVDVTLSTYFLLRAEYRYIRATGSVDNRVYEGFNDIDLSGSRVSLGLAFRI